MRINYNKYVSLMDYIDRDPSHLTILRNLKILRQSYKVDDIEKLVFNSVFLNKVYFKNKEIK